MEYRNVTKSISFAENRSVSSHVHGMVAPKKEITSNDSIFYFLATATGGGVSTAFTRVTVTPLDVVKCRMQVEPQRYKSFVNGLVITSRKEGLRGLFGGWAPLAIGYGFRGATNYGIYEFSKSYLSSQLGEENANRYRSLVYFSSAITAEVIGDLILAPFENAKIRSQTDPSAPSQLRHSLPMIYKEGGIQSVFKGLTPLLMRQIPIVITKFMAYEFAAENIYKFVKQKSKEECSLTEQMNVTLMASCASALACAIISNPPDVWVSLMCRHKNMRLSQAIRQAGLRSIWTGLPIRIIAGTYMLAMQFSAVEITKILFDNKRV